MAISKRPPTAAELRRRKKLGDRNRTHGLTGTPTYISWKAMLARCFNKSHVAYARYGGTGITVCHKWMTFMGFLRDMGKRPIGKTLERKDRSKGYCKSNCMWATRIEQARNTKNNVVIEHNGEFKCLTDWARETGIGITTLHYRLRHGTPVFDPDTSHGKAQSRKNHCPSGHPYDESNTYRDSHGRKCRTCNRIRAQALRDRLKTNGMVS